VALLENSFVKDATVVAELNRYERAGVPLVLVFIPRDPGSAAPGVAGSHHTGSGREGVGKGRVARGRPAAFRIEPMTPASGDFEGQEVGGENVIDASAREQVIKLNAAHATDATNAGCASFPAALIMYTISYIDRTNIFAGAGPERFRT